MPALASSMASHDHTTIIAYETGDASCIWTSLQHN